MKYGLSTNPLHNWAVLRIVKTNAKSIRGKLEAIVEQHLICI
jgi:hypothetical protein